MRRKKPFYQYWALRFSILLILIYIVVGLFAGWFPVKNWNIFKVFGTVFLSVYVGVLSGIYRGERYIVTSKYRVFGPYARSRVPANSTMIAKFDNSKLLKAGVNIYDSGIEVVYPFVGKMFIERSKILKIYLISSFKSLLYHDSEEVKSPIWIRSDAYSIISEYLKGKPDREG